MVVWVISILVFGLCSFIELYVGYIYFSAYVLYFSKIKKKEPNLIYWRGKPALSLVITIIANIRGYYTPALL